MSNARSSSWSSSSPCAELDVGDGLLDDAREAGRPLAVFREPRRPVVVLGRSNTAERECRVDACRSRGVPVVQRRGGGGTVLLSRGMLVLTLAGGAGGAVRPRRAFERINAWIAEGLAAAGAPALEPRGVSDLCVGDRKVLGCSLAFSRGHLLYQGVLLVDADPAEIGELLRHPSREPEYRAGRGHRAFLTTLRESGFGGSALELALAFEDRFRAAAPLPLDPPVVESSRESGVGAA
jgi:lipoate-protein ligase A